MTDDEWPVDLGYVVCDPCFDGDCANCIGLTRTRPFCGHRCKWLEVLDDLGDWMTRTMYDSVNVSAIPAGATLIAGYVDGKYANADAMHTRFAHATVVRITVLGTTLAAHVVDIETGDCTPKSGAAWAKKKVAAGQHPTLYCNASTWPAVKAAVHAAGLDGRVSYWIAQYDNKAAIPAGAVAKQYIDHGPHGENVDLSVVVGYWPGVDPAPAPRYVYKRTLRRGMIGADIVTLKRRLRALGYHPRFMGVGPYFSRGLDVAVRQFQRAHHLAVDGVVGPVTAKAIG